MQGCNEACIPAFGTLWDFVSHLVCVRLRRVFEADCWPSESQCEARPVCAVFQNFFSFPMHFLCIRLRAVLASPRRDNRLSWYSWLNGLDIMLSDAFGCRATVKYMI
jgi:hypothetical protein